MVALDWPALAIPEEYGGIGLSFVEMAGLVEELGRAVAPGPLLATVTQFAPMVREVGTVEQRQRFLSPVASGAVTGTVALADHPLGWALDDVTMTAERAEGGWVLARQQARRPGRRRQSPRSSSSPGPATASEPSSCPPPRRACGVVHSLDASRPLSTATLDRVLVPDDRALGEPGSAASTLGVTRALHEATVALALETVGACDALFQMVLAYVKDRKQFGVPDRLVPGGQAQDDQHVPRHRACPLPVLLRRRRHRRGHSPCGPPPSPWPRPPATTASAWCAATRSSPSVASASPGSTTRHLFIKRAETSGALFGGSAQHSLAVAGIAGGGLRLSGPDWRRATRRSG